MAIFSLFVFKFRQNETVYNAFSTEFLFILFAVWETISLEVIYLESFHCADLSNRVTNEIKRLENQISKDIHKDIYLIAYEKNAQSKEVPHD